MARKTVSVQSLLDHANFQLARKDDEATPEFKAGVCVMLHKVLHDSGNYMGFSFLAHRGKSVWEIENIGVDHPEYYNREYH